MRNEEVPHLVSATEKSPAATGRSLLFCVTGSIAAPSVLPVLRILVERNVFRTIRVAMSQSALRFVRPEPFAVMSGQACLVDLFEDAANGIAMHVATAGEADVALIAPATAGTMAKLAHGMTEGTVPMLLSVFNGPRILVPAVHSETRRQASYQRNEAALRDDGFLFCGPVRGYSISENRRGADIGGIPPAEIIAAYVEYVARTGSAPDVDFAIDGLVERDG